jgi:hypothetical protein
MYIFNLDIGQFVNEKIKNIGDFAHASSNLKELISRTYFF